MTRNEWMSFHGFDEEDMERIESLVKSVDGTIVQITLITNNLTRSLL
jgi:hypothetical protein